MTDECTPNSGEVVGTDDEATCRDTIPEAIDDAPPVRVVQREVVHTSRAFYVRRDIQELADGSRHPWETVIFGGSARVLPIDLDGGVYLLRQYRPLIQQHSLEAVGGRLEDGEPAEEAARRELLEETGITARLIALGTAELSTSAVRCEEHLFLAVVESIGEARPDAFERQTLGPLRRISLDEAVTMVMRQEIRDLSTATLILMAAEHVRRHGEPLVNGDSGR
ncbi:MAG: NUDIX hydrolase [Chloroflexota bacterium]